MDLTGHAGDYLSALPRAMAVFDGRGKPVFVTSRFLGLFPALRHSQWVLEDYLRLLCQGTMKADVREALEQKVPVTGYVSTGAGTYIYLSHEIFPEPLNGLVCEVKDVSEQLDDLRIRHVLRDLVDKTVDAIGMADTERYGFFLNARMEDALGISMENLPEKKFRVEDVQPFGVGAFDVADALDMAEKQGSIIAESRVQNLQSGQVKIFSQVINSHSDLIEDKPIYSTILRDISELYRYRQELEASNKQLERMLGRSESELHQSRKEVEYGHQLWRSIVDHHLNLVIIADGDGEVLFANQIADGRSGQELCGRHILDLVERGFREEFRGQFERLQGADGGSVSFEASFVLAPDIRFSGLASMSAFRRADGNRVVTMLVADITEQLRDRDRLLESRKLAATGRMAAKLAHEINNPLAGIRSALTVVQDDLSPDMASQRYLGLAVKEIDRVSRIIKQLYGLYRPQSERLTAIRLRDLVEDCVLLLDARLHARNVLLQLTGGDGVLVQAADNSLRQVLLNVLTNALDASDNGGIIQVRLFCLRGWCGVAIRDQGSGLGVVNEERVFEAFYSTKQTADGSGLGLGMSVSRGLMRSMGGEIRIRNRRGGPGALCVLFLRAMKPGDR